MIQTQMGGREYGQRPEQVSMEAGDKGMHSRTAISDQQTDSGWQTECKQWMTSDKWTVDHKRNASSKQPAAAATGTMAMEMAATAATATAAAITGQQSKQLQWSRNRNQWGQASRSKRWQAKTSSSTSNGGSRSRSNGSMRAMVAARAAVLAPAVQWLQQ